MEPLPRLCKAWLWSHHCRGHRRARMRRAQRGRTGQSCGSLISMVKRDQMYILHMYEIRLCPRSMFSYHVSLNNRTCVDALGKGWMQKSAGLVSYWPSWPVVCAVANVTYHNDDSPIWAFLSTSWIWGWYCTSVMQSWVYLFWRRVVRENCLSNK